MSDLFRDILLSTSRVIWPAEPGRERTRILISADRRIGIAHTYLALLAFPQEPDRRNKLLAALAHMVNRRNAAPPREIRSAFRPGLNRLARAFELARRLPFDPKAAARALAEARNKQRVDWAAPVRARDIAARELNPALPTLHLALPLVAGRDPAFAERYPKLAPAGIPATVAGLIASDAWPCAALDAAERWRQALAIPELVEVRARWLAD